MFKKITISLLLSIFAYNLNAMDQASLNMQLIREIESNDIKEVEKIIQAGANVNANPYYGDKISLHYAAKKGKKNIVQLLIDKGADINAKDSSDVTPLHCAAAWGHKDVTRLFISKGAELYAKCKAKGHMPLHCAVHNGEKETAKLLLQAGVDVNTKDNYGRSPVHEFVNAYKVQLSEEIIAQLIELLIESGADVNAQDDYGNTVLHLAVLDERTHDIELLLIYGANEDIENQQGKTAVDIAKTTKIKELITNYMPIVKR